MKWDRKISLTLAAVVVLFSTAGAPSAKAQAKKPNVVFILVDNVGWGNFGVYGGTIPTPRIDKLANEGIRFNNYNVEVQCTPTRSAIHDRAASGSLGDLQGPVARTGEGRDGPVGIHHCQTALRRWLFHRVVRQVAPGRHARATAERSRLRRVMGHHEQLGRSGLYRVAAV